MAHVASIWNSPEGRRINKNYKKTQRKTNLQRGSSGSTQSPSSIVDPAELREKFGPLKNYEKNRKKD